MSQKYKVMDFLLTTGAHRHRPVQPAEIPSPLGLIRMELRGDREQRARLSVALLCTSWTRSEVTFESLGTSPVVLS